MTTNSYTTSGSTALTVASQEADVYQRINDPISAVEKLGAIIATSGLFGCTKVEQGQVLALQCLSERKPPLELAKTYHLIEGKLSMRADAMLAKFQMSGGTVKWHSRTDKEVSATFSIRGNELPFTAKLDEFVANGVATGRDGKLKDNWRKFPRQMLTARVISEAVRLLAPEIVFGIYTPEEVQDFSEPKVVVPAPAPAAPKPAVDVAKLEELLSEQETEVNAFLIARSYVQPGQTFRDVQPDLANRIIGNPKVFIEAVNARASS
jgi:hypothetical protein